MQVHSSLPLHDHPYPNPITQPCSAGEKLFTSDLLNRYIGNFTKNCYTQITQKIRFSEFLRKFTKELVKSVREGEVKREEEKENAGG